MELFSGRLSITDFKSLYAITIATIFFHLLLLSCLLPNVFSFSFNLSKLLRLSAIIALLGLMSKIYYSKVLYLIKAKIRILSLLSLWHARKCNLFSPFKDKGIQVFEGEKLAQHIPVKYIHTHIPYAVLN